MGVEGTLEYFSDLLSSVRKGKKKKKKQIQTVALKVRMDCEGCVQKVKKVVSGVKGVKSVEVDLKQQKVTATGYMEAKKVLEAAKSTKKKVELWPYVPYTLVAHPYVSQAYDKKAPPNMVRKIPNTATINETTIDDKYTILFSDENPNSCSIM
ncbi:heavy metal-associated isoprenylated plant protein 24-like [Juglans microcarpa x Juglans regia]|uniref:heavy metal-associated isoprenylated plant protein 24-like n=1 Tax=Juglans microcarpa x Juglans regia TaxID=2249226 RepID=UPI001B7EA8BB|nr:heavy metal-associated isoprenylated plant protein 24-like [Juglans microcarpa x Juglans regia]XP_041016331.1 heavy metal-associated isoprenylated plant protein 24-like [Juglans microcarpa x Juglans regia]